jgi:hypothetical protein
VKRPKWLGESHATKVDKLKRARQQTDQRMKHQDTLRSGDSKVVRGKMVLSPDDPMARGPQRYAAS